MISFCSQDILDHVLKDDAIRCKTTSPFARVEAMFMFVTSDL